MSLTREEIYALTDELQSVLSHAHICSFKAIEQRKFVLQCDKEGELLQLLFCFQEPFLRFHLSSGKSQFCDSSFASAIDSSISSAKIEEIKMINQDRIIQLYLKKGAQPFFLVGEFFSKRPNLYLLDRDLNIVASLNPTASKIYHYPENIKVSSGEIHPAPASSDLVEARYELQEKEALFLKLKRTYESMAFKQLSRTKKLYEKALQDNQKALAWKEIQHEGVLLQANFYQLRKGLTEIRLVDWEKPGEEEHVLLLDPLLGPQENIEKRFHQSKKLKASLNYTEDRILVTGKMLEKQQEIVSQVAETTSLEALHAIGLFFEKQKPQRKSEKSSSLPYLEFYSESGLKIWVGKNAKSNEKLTFSYASGSDWWFHVCGCPGSHVILKVKKNQEPDPESIQDAILLALIHSKAKDKGEAEIHATQCKYVSRIGRGKAGQVQISKHKTLYAKLDQNRFRSIKSRSSLKDKSSNH